MTTRATPVRQPAEPVGETLGLLLAPVDRVCACGAGFSAPPWAARCDACEAKRERVEESQRASADLRGSGIPSELIWATFDSPDLPARVPDAVVRQGITYTRHALELVLRTGSAPTGRPVLLLAGPPGSGKSSLAASMARAVMERTRGLGRPAARFLDALELELLMREHRLGTALPAPIEQARARPFAVLDDVGQDQSDAAANALKELVHARHAAGRPTVVTTGLDRAALGRRYGGGFLRRVLCGGVVLVGCEPGWGDYGSGGPS